MRIPAVIVTALVVWAHPRAAAAQCGEQCVVLSDQATSSVLG
jgi:hypothetical protein